MADKNYLLPRGDAGKGYADALNRLIDREKINLIAPNNDTEVRSVSQYRDCLHAPVFLPRHSTVELCQDKLAMNQLLQTAGFRVAQSFAVDRLQGVDEIFKDHFAGHERVWVRMRRGSGSKGSLPSHNAEHARFWIQTWHQFQNIPLDQFMLCEYLPGRDFAFQSLWKDGDLVIAKTCQRVDYVFSQNNPSGTSSSPRIGRLLVNEQVNDICTRAVKALDPHATGNFCIDLKEDADGVPCITEINIGRFFMITIVFNTVGKYNMAELYLRLAFGEEVSVPLELRYSDIGKETTYLIRELDNTPKVLTETELKNSYQTP